MEDRFDMMEETDDETEYGQYIMMLVMLEKSFELILLSYVFFSAAFGGTGYHNSPAYPRERISYQQLMLTHGSNRDFRKAYRMNKGTFLTLLQLLTVPLIMPPPFPICGAPNGRIAPFIKLSCYLRVSAGGKVSDIGPRHGIATDYVMPCVWSIVDDINSCDDLRINFPSHDEQGVIARAFQVNSAIRQCRDGLLGNQSSCPAIREFFVTLLRSFLMLVPAVDPLPHYDAIELLEMIKAETDVYRRETYLSMLLDDVIGPENSDEDKSITVVNNTDDDNDSLAFSQGLRLE